MRNFALLHISLSGANHFVCVLVFFALLLNGNKASHTDLIALSVLYDADVGELVFDDTDPVFYSGLKIAGFFVFSVFRKIAKRAGS